MISSCKKRRIGRNVEDVGDEETKTIFVDLRLQIERCTLQHSFSLIHNLFLWKFASSSSSPQEEYKQSLLHILSIIVSPKHLFIQQSIILVAIRRKNLSSTISTGFYVCGKTFLFVMTHRGRQQMTSYLFKLNP